MLSYYHRHQQIRENSGLPNRSVLPNTPGLPQEGGLPGSNTSVFKKRRKLYKRLNKSYLKPEEADPIQHDDQDEEKEKELGDPGLQELLEKNKKLDALGDHLDKLSVKTLSTGQQIQQILQAQKATKKNKALVQKLLAQEAQLNVQSQLLSPR